MAQAESVVAEPTVKMTAEDLLSELRARVNAGAISEASRGAGGEASSPAEGPRADVRDVDSADLALQLKALQRQVYRQDRADPADGGQARSIYGNDDRRDLYQVSDGRLRNDADCVVVIVHQSNLINNGNGTSRLKTFNFQSRYGMCPLPSEPFLNQTTLGQGGKPSGSGFLVAPDVIATAGHCIDAASLSAARFVFGYRMTDAVTANVDVKNSDVYRGVALIGHVYTVEDADWALVRLDRPVPDHHIASIRRSGRVPDNALLHVIGHPCELPLKVAGNAAITNNAVSTHFYTTLDAYGGNSGSPVFNSLTHEVEGILVRGQTDFQSLGACKVSMVYPNTGPGGEECTRTTLFASLLGPGWQQLDDNRLTTSITAGGAALYQLHSSGELFRYTGTPMVGWTKLDNNPLTKEIAADGTALYQRHSNGQIYRYTGTPMTGWALIDSTPTTKTIMALGGKLYKRHGVGAIFRYTGTPITGWQQLDDNPLTIALADDGTSLYQLHSNGQIYRYTGTPMSGWALIDDNPLAKEIVASGGRLYQRHGNGEIYQYTGTPMTGWALLDDNPQTAALAADGTRLYQRHKNGQIYRYTGIPMTGWAVLDSGTINPSKSVKGMVAAGGQLYQHQSTGLFGQPHETSVIRRAI